MHRRQLSVLLVALASAAPLVLLQSPATAAPVAAKPYDFNGDGFADLVVSADSLRVGSVKDAGGVVVFPGSSRGISSHAQTITQASAHVPGEATSGYRFGAALASADFNRDGFADLAVGAPSDAVGGDDEAAGAVTVLFGSRSGLTGKGSYVLTRTGAPLDNSPGSAADDGFGVALTTADLDGDGWPELVVGAPYVEKQDDSVLDPGGSVTVFQGTDGHFSTTRSSVLLGVQTGPTTDEYFGSALAVGDVDGTSGTDLVVASAHGGRIGSVSVCPSETSCDQIASGSRYARLASLAVGNVSGTSRPEIVAGAVPDPYAQGGGGSVFTFSLSGSGTHTTATAAQLTQATRGVPGRNENHDAFGQAVALGDLDGDGYADLVVGSPGEGIGSRRGAGRVTVVHGGEGGYRTTGNETYDQNTPGVPSRAEKGDAFGTALALGDHDGDGRLDLVVGAPAENGSGSITTLPSSGTDLTGEGARTVTLKTLGRTHRDDAGFGDVVAG